MGPLPTHSWILPNSILIESQVITRILDTLPIFDWQVSLAYATTFLCILLLQYIFKLIPCSELSFRGPNMGPHQRVIDQCYEFVSNYLRPEPKKSTVIPKRSWESVNLDFRWPYPDGHYNLVMVDQRTRYPVVEEVHSASFKKTRIKLKEIFATWETPRKILTDIPIKRICRIRRRIPASQNNSITPTNKWRSRIFYETAK